MIEFRNVVKRFGTHTVLQNFNLHVQSGEILFILGTSGTGKSVLLKTLVGLLQADAGEIWIDGQEVTHFSEEEYLPVRQKCGMVFQQPALFDSLSVFDNVAFGLRRHLHMDDIQLHERVQSSLQAVYLQEVADQFPAQLSYGMQKRVSLARTIALQPKILLFDEPTTGLDPVTTQAVNHLIKELSKKLQTTSVVVSHDMHCALDIADRIVVLDQGQVIEQGTPAHLLSSKVPLVQEFLREILAEKGPLQ